MIWLTCRRKRVACCVVLVLEFSRTARYFIGIFRSRQLNHQPVSTTQYATPLSSHTDTACISSATIARFPFIKCQQPESEWYKRSASQPPSQCLHRHAKRIDCVSNQQDADRCGQRADCFVQCNDAAKHMIQLATNGPRTARIPDAVMIIPSPNVLPSP